jgi:hypothetical protein
MDSDAQLAKLGKQGGRDMALMLRWITTMK